MELVPRTPSSDPEDQHHNPELLAAVGEAVLNQDYVALSRVLNRPSKELEATLRKERRKLELALLPQAQRHLLHFSARYERILDKAVQVLERHWIENPMALETMTPQQAMETIKALSSILQKLYGSVALQPTRFEIEEKKTGIDPTDLPHLFGMIAKAKAEGKRIDATDAAFESVQED